MNALCLQQPKSNIVYTQLPIPEIDKDEVLVKVKAAALNHRDVYITQGLYPGVETPVILGSDGSGVVKKIGSKVNKKWIDKDVIINPGIGWEHKSPVQPLDYSILGMPQDGCLAEYIKVKANQIFEKPEHLSFEQAAALPLAGLTAYRALFSKANCKKDEHVLISGIGGGVALMAFQFALAITKNIFVTSGSEDKINKAISLGAKGGISYKTDNWHKELIKKSNSLFDVIIDSAGGDGFSKFIDLAQMGGRIAFYGGTRGKFTINPQKMFWKQLTVLGSTMGSNEEFKEMLDFVNKYKIEPVVEKVWDLKDGVEAFEYMNQGKQFGKIVLKP